MQIPIENSVN